MVVDLVLLNVLGDAAVEIAVGCRALKAIFSRVGLVACLSEVVGRLFVKVSVGVSGDETEPADYRHVTVPVGVVIEVDTHAGSHTMDSLDLV